MFVFAATAKAKIAPVGCVRDGSHRGFMSRTRRTCADKNKPASPQYAYRKRLNVRVSLKTMSRSSLGFNYSETYKSDHGRCVHVLL